MTRGVRIYSERERISATRSFAQAATDEELRLLADQVGRIVLTSVSGVTCRGARVGIAGQFLVRGEFWIVEGNALVIAPERRGEVIVCHRLAVETIKSVEALLERISRAAHWPQTPFAEGTKRVAQFLKCQG